MMKNRGKTQGFSTRSDAKKEETDKKTDPGRQNFENKGLERATRAKKIFAVNLPSKSLHFAP